MAGIHNTNAVLAIITELNRSLVGKKRSPCWYLLLVWYLYVTWKNRLKSFLRSKLFLQPIRTVVRVGVSGAIMIIFYSFWTFVRHQYWKWCSCGVPMKPRFVPARSVELRVAVDDDVWIFSRMFENKNSLFHTQRAVQFSEWFVARDWVPYVVSCEIDDEMTGIYYKTQYFVFWWLYQYARLYIMICLYKHNNNRETNSLFFNRHYFIIRLVRTIVLFSITNDNRHCSVSFLTTLHCTWHGADGTTSNTTTCTASLNLSPWRYEPVNEVYMLKWK